ncbi:UNVERIFIED_CONTAM: hypothetical protein K2H54_040339 [Gekko kuhli]
MPKKKKKSTEGPNSRAQDQEEEESRGESSAKLKRSFGDAFIVISDSDGELPYPQEESFSWALSLCW